MDITKGIIQRSSSDKGASKNGRKYLFIIGIDEYKYCPKLYNAVKDAQKIQELLLEKFQFEKKNTWTLINKHNRFYLFIIKKLLYLYVKNLISLKKSS